MKRKDDKQYLKYASVALATGLIMGGAAVILQPEPVNMDLIKTEAYVTGVNSVQIPEPVNISLITEEAFKKGVESVEPIKETSIETVYENITIEVPVDNGNLKLVLDEIYDNDGKIEYLTDDLDEDEVDQIVDRIDFINKVKSEAVDYVKKELADELDNVVVTMNDNSTVELDEDDIEKVRIDDDDDEVIVDDVDYDDKDAEVTITGRFRHDDVWFTFETEVEFEDNEVDSMDVVLIKEE